MNRDPKKVFIGNINTVNKWKVSLPEWMKAGFLHPSEKFLKFFDFITYLSCVLTSLT
jgi:hypothetical protein